MKNAAAALGVILAIWFFMAVGGLGELSPEYPIGTYLLQFILLPLLVGGTLIYLMGAKHDH